MPKEFTNSVLAEANDNLSLLSQATQLQNDAAKVNFDWPSIVPVFSKLQEEIRELQTVINNTPEHHNRLSDELGDVLFTCVNLARKLAIDPEQALLQANQKFRQRFHLMEQKAQERKTPLAEMNLDTLEEMWKESKLVLDKV